MYCIHLLAISLLHNPWQSCCYLVHRFCGEAELDNSLESSESGCYISRSQDSYLCRCKEDYCNALPWICHGCNNCDVQPGRFVTCHENAVRKCFATKYSNGTGERLIIVIQNRGTHGAGVGIRYNWEAEKMERETGCWRNLGPDSSIYYGRLL